MDIEIGRDDDGPFVRSQDGLARLSPAEAMQIIAALASTDVDPVVVSFETSSENAPSAPSPLDVAANAHRKPPVPSLDRPPLQSAVYSVSSVAENHFPTNAAEALGRAETISFVSSSRMWAERMSVTDEQVRRVCEDPDDEWLSETGEVFYVVGDDIGLTVSARDGAVLAVRPAEAMAQFRASEPSPTGLRRGHGGRGRRYPSDGPALHKLLVERGFRVQPVANGHYEVSRDGVSRQISATPSDCRTIINDIKGLERTFGISLARTP